MSINNLEISIYYGTIRTMVENASKPKRETIAQALFRTSWILLLAVLILVGAFFLRSSLLKKHKNASTLHHYNPSTLLDISTVAADNISSFAGNGYEIGASAAVDKEYFSDALFVGDSITSGFTIYDMFEGFNCIYKVGVNTHSAMTDEFHTTSSGQAMTMVEAVKYYSPRKLYIMLGTNGINWASTEWLLSGYKELVSVLMRENPNCSIILQSIPPVSEEKAASNSGFSKENFDKYNNGIRQLAIEQGCFFLDINSAFATSSGYLDPAYAAGDGLHFGYAGYQRWYDYLMTHTLQGDSIYIISPEGFLSIRK